MNKVMPPKPAPKKASGAKVATSKTGSKTGSKPTTKTTATAKTTNAAAKTTDANKHATSSTISQPVKKEVEKAEGKPQELVIPFKQLNTVLDDGDKTVKESGKCIFLIDTPGQAATFLRYRDCNYLQGPNTNDMQPETIRKAVIGSIRFGKPLALDMMEVDMFEACSEKFDQVSKGLMNMILDKSILTDDKFLELVKESDGPEYTKSKVNDYTTRIQMEGYQFVLITKNVSPPPDLLKRMYPVRILLNA